MENIANNWIWMMVILPAIIYAIRGQIELTWLSVTTVLGRKYRKGDYLEICGPDGSWAKCFIIAYYFRLPFKKKKGVWIGQRDGTQFQLRCFSYQDWKGVATRRPFSTHEVATWRDLVPAQIRN